MYIMPADIPATNILGGCIAEYKNIWSKEKINNYIDSIEKVSSDESLGINFVPAGLIGNMNNTIRTNSHLGLSVYANENEVMREINNDFHLTLNSGVSWYMKQFISGDPIYFSEPFNVLKYKGGEKYDAHYDGSTGTARSVSAILYLNDNYEGGELEFVNFNIKIKPVAGTLYLFPSNYAYSHIAHPVQSGTKYAIVTWMHDRILGQDGRNPFLQDTEHQGHNHSHE